MYLTRNCVSISPHITPYPGSYERICNSKGRPDEEVAIESWERHQMRNKVFVVDINVEKCANEVYHICAAYIFSM
jgi:hypothetical protein